MSEYTYESATPDVYNAGVVRTPSVGEAEALRAYKGIPVLWADVLGNKDVVGGQVEEGFKALLGQPVAETSTTGVYEASEDPYTDAVGVLLMSTDAYDGPRMINVVKGGSIRTDIGALAELDDTELGSLATALGGKYDATFKSIKF